MARDRRERRRLRRERDPAGWRECRRAQAQRRRHRHKALVFAHYGSRCACCGATERLTVDHVNGDGAEHRRALGSGGTKLYTWLVVHGFPPGFQILCEPCNQSKGRKRSCTLSHNISETGATVSAPAGLSVAC